MIIVSLQGLVSGNSNVTNNLSYRPFQNASARLAYELDLFRKEYYAMLYGGNVSSAKRDTACNPHMAEDDSPSCRYIPDSTLIPVGYRFEEPSLYQVYNWHCDHRQRRPRCPLPQRHVHMSARELL